MIISLTVIYVNCCTYINSVISFPSIRQHDLSYYHRRSRMVNMWYFHQKKFLAAEDPVLPLLINFIFWQQKIGRSSAAKDLEAEYPVLFLSMGVHFWQQRSANSRFHQFLLMNNFFGMQKIGRSSAPKKVKIVNNS